MTIPVLAIAVGSLLIYSAITGQNPLSIIKVVLTGDQTVVTGANVGATLGTAAPGTVGTDIPNRGKSSGGTF